MCSVSELIRDVKIAICTSGEPESFSFRRYSPINSRLRSFVIMGCRDSFAPAHLAPSFAAENLLYFPWPSLAGTKPTLLPKFKPLNVQGRRQFARGCAGRISLLEGVNQWHASVTKVGHVMGYYR